MPWYGWALVAYVALDRFLTVAMCGQGRKIDLTPSFAAISLVTGTFIVWAIIALGS